MESADSSQGSLIPKKKRGRPPKNRYSLPNLVDFPTVRLPKETISELQMGYNSLKEMLGMSQLRPLIEKPEELMYGFYDYYDVIEEPMWLLKITKKYAEQQYMSIVEVMKDLRLVLENCYRFWGKKHKFVKQALRAERILDKHLMSFPNELRSKCCLVLYNSEDAVSAEGVDAFASEVPSEYSSKILRNLEIEPITTKMMATLGEMQRWEEEILKGPQLARQINVMPELAEIGQFLLMAREILCLKPISQYEIERMLLIARESITLATIMTSFLCNPALRSTLYFKPIMVYDVWVSLLQKKLDIWYNTYLKYNNRMTVFIKYGVEPTFFECLGEVNPMTDTPFHELEFHKKAVIVKALCSSTYHSNKKIDEYFNVVNEDALKPKLLFSNSKHEYVSLFSPEIRIYRSSKVCLDIDATIESVFPRYFDFYPKAKDHLSDPEIPFSKKQKFYLVASDRESLTDLSKMFAKRKRGRISINKLLSEEKNRELSLIGLRALYSQWKKAIYKDQISVSLSQQYWITRNDSANANEENPTEFTTVVKTGDTPPENLGKRIMKRKFPLEDEGDAFSSNEEKPNEDEVSDWEDGNIRRSRRIKKVSGLPRFFDHKYMKFENASGDDFVYGTEGRKSNLDEKPAAKKPRKKREKKVVDDEGLIDGTKVVRRRSSKKMNKENSGIALTSNPLGIMQDEPYLPPLDLPKFVQSAQPLISDAQSKSSGPKNDLIDWGTWDFGVQPPLKPVEDLPGPLPAVPEEGEKKILELGAFKTCATPAPTPAPPLTPIPARQNVPELFSFKPSKPPKPVAPPRKHQIKSLHPSGPFMTNISNYVRPSVSAPGRGRGRILPMPMPGPSNRVVLPWEDLTKSRLLPLDPRFLPADAIVVKTGPAPTFRFPVQRPAAQPPQPQHNLYFKRKVNLPARPLNVPVINGQEVSVFQSQIMNSLDSSSTVLYIPSGTPTITIPSVSGSSEEKTLTVL